MLCNSMGQWVGIIDRYWMVCNFEEVKTQQGLVLCTYALNKRMIEILYWLSMVLRVQGFSVPNEFVSFGENCYRCDMVSWTAEQHHTKLHILCLLFAALLVYRKLHKLYKIFTWVGCLLPAYRVLERVSSMPLPYGNFILEKWECEECRPSRIL